MQTSEFMPAWMAEQGRRPGVRLAIGIVIAVLAYVFAIVGDIGRTNATFITAVPSCIALVWWRRWPVLALGLVLAGAAALGLTSMLYYDEFRQGGVNSVICFVVAACLTEFGLAIHELRSVRWTAAIPAVLLVVAPAASVGSLLFLFFGVVLAALPIVAGWGWRQATARSSVTSALVVSETRQHDTEREVAIEQERNRVAREVHDVVAHSLAVVIAQADGARYQARNSPETVAPALDAIADTARGALIEVRTLLESLRHTQGSRPAPVLHDLDTLFAQLRELGLETDVQNFGQQRALGDATQLAVYRIVQEALTNALRHGDTDSPVSVDFDWGDRTLAVTVTSTLRGDGVPQLDGPGHGIPGMRERAALAGGDLTVGVGNRGTFRMRVVLPIPAVRPVPPRRTQVQDEADPVPVVHDDSDAGSGSSVTADPPIDASLTVPLATRPYQTFDDLVSGPPTPPEGVRVGA